MSDYTPAHLTALNEAIASGVKKVKHNGKEIEFDSFADLVARRDFVAREIAGATSSARTRFATFSKGRN